MYLQPLNLTTDEIAEKLQISRIDLDNLINGKVDVTPAMAQKLSQVLGRSADSWLSMQKKTAPTRRRNQMDETPDEFAELFARIQSPTTSARFKMLRYATPEDLATTFKAEENTNSCGSATVAKTMSPQKQQEK